MEVIRSICFLLRRVPTLRIVRGQNHSYAHAHFKSQETFHTSHLINAFIGKTFVNPLLQI